MDENRIVELLTRKIAGEANAEELGELAYLLKKSPDAVYYEALLEQVWELGQEDAGADLNQTFKKHKAKFKEELKFKKSASSMLRRPGIIILASVFLLGAAIFLLRGYNPNRSKKRIEIVAGKGVRKEVKLPDGTVVWLNSESKILYDPNMLDGEIREVALTGEAFFNVAYDNDRPFITNTSKVAVTALGTRFNIKEYPGENKSETTLIRGSIELAINGRSDQKFLLKPSEKFALVEKRKVNFNTYNNSVITIEQISPVEIGGKEYLQDISWFENKLVFHDESLEDLLPKFERWYNVEIDLTDQKVRDLRFTGILIDENVVEALEVMKLIEPFNYKLIGNKIKIY